MSRVAFSVSFMVFRATWKALGWQLPTPRTSPSAEDDATGSPLLPLTLTVYLTADKPKRYANGARFMLIHHLLK